MTGRGWRKLELTAPVLLALAGCELVSGISGGRELARMVPVSAAGCDSGGACGNLQGSGGGPSAGAGSQAQGQGGGGDSGVAGAESAAGAGGVDPNGGQGGAVQEPVLLVPPTSLAAFVCNDESPATTLYVPGGSFAMGRSVDGADAYLGEANELPEHTASVSPFWLDKYEVTVGRFRMFVENFDDFELASDAGAHAGVVASGWRGNWTTHLPSGRAGLEAQMIGNGGTCNVDFRTWTRAAGNGDCLPINCVDWYLAYAFCIWDGGRLPTEAEWEFAAAGGQLNQLFPWGSDAPDQNRAVFGCGSNCAPSDIRPVGSRPDGRGRFGQMDLAGSLYERVRDVYDPELYALSLASEKDFINLSRDATADQGPGRGGGFLGYGPSLRVTYREEIWRSHPWEAVGFRCARDPG